MFLYDGDNFDGSWQKEFILAGDYTAVNNFDFPNDDLSSLRVGPGCEVTLWQHGLGNGENLLGWEANFWAPGEYNKAALEAAGAITNEASSMRVTGIILEWPAFRVVRSFISMIRCVIPRRVPGIVSMCPRPGGVVACSGEIRGVVGVRIGAYRM